MDYINDYLQMDFIITHNATCLFDSSNLWMMKQNVCHKNDIECFYWIQFIAAQMRVLFFVFWVKNCFCVINVGFSGHN